MPKARLRVAEAVRVCNMRHVRNRLSSRSTCSRTSYCRRIQVMTDTTRSLWNCLSSIPLGTLCLSCFVRSKQMNYIKNKDTGQWRLAISTFSREIFALQLHLVQLRLGTTRLGNPPCAGLFCFVRISDGQFLTYRKCEMREICASECSICQGE